jgi:hypothetical protein
MSYTNPSAYSNTYLQAFYDFTSGHYYNNVDNFDVSVWSSSNLGYENSYISDKAIMCDFEQSNDSIELIQEYGIDVELSSINSGMFIGDYSNVTGHFNSGYSSLGANFQDCALYIKNSRNFNHGSSTFIFSYTKKDTKPEILFSSINKDTDIGFEIGVNSANKLYLEWPEEHGTQVITLNTVNYNKNIYVIDIDININKLVLSRWDGFEEILLSKVVNFKNCDCFKGGNLDWVIGSGVYRGDEGINSQPEPYKCESYIDKFLYFNGFLAQDSKIDFIKSFYEKINYNPRLYEDINSGITGYNKVLDYSVSGVTGYADVITGYKEYSSNYTSLISEELRGNASIGDTYYEFDSSYQDNLNELGGPLTSGIYLEKITNSNLTEVITGFSSTEYDTEYSWSDVGVEKEPLYYHSGVSGKLYDVYRHEPIYADSREQLKEKGSYVMSGIFPIEHLYGEMGYGANKYTYLGARNKRTDYLEHFQGVNQFSIASFADIDIFNGFTLPFSITMSSDLSYDFNKIALYINGVSQSWGDLKFEDDKCSPNQDLWSLPSGNFGIYQWDEDDIKAGINKILYNDENISLTVDHPVVDVLTDIPSTGVWLDYEKYSSYETNNESLLPEGNKLFFNGQKLISGQSYYFNPDGNFRIIDSDGFFANASGYFHSESSFHEDLDSNYREVIRGLASYDINPVKSFIPGSCVSFLNGVRLDPKAYLYHSDVDLIKQGEGLIVETESFTAYNNSVTNQDQLPTEMELYELPKYDKNWALRNVLDESGNIVDISGSEKIITTRSTRRSSARDAVVYENSKEISELTFD